MMIIRMLQGLRSCYSARYLLQKPLLLENGLQQTSSAYFSISSHVCNPRSRSDKNQKNIQPNHKEIIDSSDAGNDQLMSNEVITPSTTNNPSKSSEATVPPTSNPEWANSSATQLLQGARHQEPMHLQFPSDLEENEEHVNRVVDQTMGFAPKVKWFKIT